MTYRYLLIIEKTDSGYSAYSPDVTGCVATGKTPGAAKSAMNEAIEFHLDGLAQIGEPIPQPQARHAFATIKSAKPARPVRHAAYHIVPAEGKWVVKKTGASRASRIYGDKGSAIQHAKQLAIRQSGIVVTRARTDRLTGIAAQRIVSSSIDPNTASVRSRNR